MAKTNPETDLMSNVLLRLKAVGKIEQLLESGTATRVEIGQLMGIRAARAAAALVARILSGGSITVNQYERLMNGSRFEEAVNKLTAANAPTGPRTVEEELILSLKDAKVHAARGVSWAKQPYVRQHFVNIVEQLHTMLWELGAEVNRFASPDVLPEED